MMYNKLTKKIAVAAISTAALLQVLHRPLQAIGSHKSQLSWLLWQVRVAARIVLRVCSNLSFKKKIYQHANPSCEQGWRIRRRSLALFEGQRG